MSVCRAPVLAGSSRFGNDAYTKIMLHMEGANGGTTFIDTAYGQKSAHTWTASSATTNTGTVKFGTASLNTGAAVGWIETPDSADFTLGSSDFTYDCWFNRQGGDGTARFLFGQSDSGLTASTRVAEIFLTSGNVFRFQVWAGGTNTTVTGTTTFTATGWNHVAGVRTGNILNLFVNGTKEGGDVAFSSTIQDSSNKLSIGRLGEEAENWNGFIDEFRLSVGVARWTANFTPPTGPYG